MRWLLRATAGVSLLWAAGLFFAQEVFFPAGSITPLVVALATALAVAHLAFAFAFWRASGETPPNRTVIYAAILLLLLKTAADLYALLALLEGGTAMLTLADLVLSVGFAVGIIEALPATLHPQAGNAGSS